MLNMLPNHGGLHVTQNPGTLISGGNHGLYGLPAGRGDTDLSLSGAAASPTGWAGQISAGANSGEMRISHPAGAIERGTGGLSATFLRMAIWTSTQRGA